MVILRGEIWWADLGEPRGSDAGYARPVLIVQDDALNISSIRTVIAVPLTSNLKYRDVGSNVILTCADCQLPKESVAQIHLLQAVPRERLERRLSLLNPNRMKVIDRALMQSLGLFD